MEGLITLLNSTSKSFVNFASAMLVQSSVLITALLLLDLFLRKRVRAVFRYWIWMLVLVKLVLPTTLSSPTSPGYWFDMSIFQVQDRISTISGRSGTPNMVVTPAPRATPPEAFVVQPDIEYTYPSPSQQAAITSEKDSSVGASGPTIEWQGMVFLGWLAVILAMLLLLFQRMFFVRGLLAQSAQPSGGMAKALGQGCDRIRLSKQPDLRPSPVATSPSVCGLLRPTILIPQNLVQKVNTEQFMTVLLHELIHIKRGDLWVSFSQTVLQIIYFYNPLLWLANSVIRKIREQAVDEAVLVAMGERAEKYPKTLLHISRLTFSRPALSLRLIGVVESKKTLIGRIKHIAGRPFPKTAKLGFVGIIALFVIAAILLPMAKAMSGPPSFTIKGTVTDAETGQPIEGAKVGDQYYKGAKQSTVSSASGNYSYKTWYEEHDIVAQAEGYDSEKKTLTTKLFGKEEERTIHFQLKPKETKEQGKVKPALQSPWKNEYEFVAIFLEAMKNKNWELVDRMSRSGHIDTQDLAKFIATRGFEKTEILSIHSDGQTAAAVTSLLEPGQGKGQDYHLSFIVMKEDESFVLKEIGQVWDGEKKKFINGFLKSYPDTKPVKFYPFCVYGKITDIHEQPMAGVTIRASCGMGTLMQTGKTISDEDGNYWLYFGPGNLGSIKETDQWGIGFQAATIYAEKDGFYEKNLCQQGNLAMAGDTEYEISVQQMKHFKGVVLPNEPYQLNFVMVHAAKIEGEVIDMEGKTVASVKFNIIGDKLYPSSSVLRNITTDESGNFVVDNVPLQTYWFDKGHSFSGLRTKDFSIDFPTRYVVELRYHEPLVGKATFELLSLEAAAMQDEDEVKKQGRLVFESYFPDDQEAGKKLDEYWENRKKIKLPPEEFFELFQNGLRRCTAQHKSNFLMQHIGGEYIWHKEPDDPRAVDIVYHASFSPEYKYYAVYSGLSVANPKSERVLKRLVDLAMEPHQLGRIIWGVKQSKQEDQFMILLEPYLQGSDPGKRERADVVVRAFRGEIDAGKWEREWNQQQKTERTISEFGDDLPRIKKTFLTGTSSERLEAIKFIRKNLVSLGHDQSFIRALDICAQDDDANVRSGVASILGGNYIWGKEIQSKEVIKILLSLSHDENRDVRYNTVYYGLSVIKEKNKEVIERLVELALNDHENNLYGRIIWGLGGPRRADRELIKQVLADKRSEVTSDQHKTASLYFLYQQLFDTEPPSVWGLDEAAGHYENFFGIYLAPQEPFQPESTDELWQELSRTLSEELRVQGFPDLNPNKVVIWVKVHGQKAHEAVVRLIKENTKLRFKSSTPLPPLMILFLEEPQSIKHLKKVYEWPKNYRQGKHSLEVVENKKKLSFGSVIERDVEIIRDDSEDVYRRKCLIDFETGRLFSLPDRFKPKQDDPDGHWEQVAYQWCMENGIDSCAYQEDERSGFALELDKELGVFLDADNTVWDSIKPADLLKEIKQENDLEEEILAAQIPDTFAFKTMEGNFGLVQILGFTENRMRIRFKMIEPLALQIPAEQIKGQVNESQRRIDTAKWSEGKALMSTIAMGIRAWRAKNNPDGSWDNNQITFADLGFIPGDLTGTYFDESNFSWVITCDKDTGKLLYTIKATAGSGIIHSSIVTLNQDNQWTQEPNYQPPANSASFETPFEFDKDIPVALVVGTNEQPDIIKINAIRFEMQGDQIVQKLYGLLRPWPHTDWRFRIELLDEQGGIIGSLKYNLHNRGRSGTATTNEPEPIKGDFCSIGPKGLTAVNKPARFAISIEQKPLETENITRTHDIRGTVVDATENMPEEFFERFSAVRSEKEAKELLETDWRPRPLPLPNVVVTLRGKSVKKQAITDAQGKFLFTSLTGPTFGPYGGMANCETYEVSAEMPIQSDKDDENRTVTVKQQVKLNSDKDITLGLRSDLITVKGKVTDAHGQPIAGTKITAVLVVNDIAYQQYLDNHDPPTWFATSKNDGSYELQGMEPMNFYRVGGYLYSGSPYKYVEIHVEANGFVQDKNNIPKVPLVSEDVLYQARRFWKSINQISQRTGRPEMHEKKELNLPAISGNTITGIDIVLDHKLEHTANK